MFLARDERTGDSVALRVLGLGSRRNVARFLREAELLQDLQHESIAAHIGHGEIRPGTVYLATAWSSGEDLRRRLSRAPLSLGETLALARQVAAGLAEGHAKGVVHRELRPSKVLLRNGRGEGATLLGFGITSANLAARTVSGSGEIVATLHYLPPEQARGEELLRPSLDIYALGCALFECLTGRVPFPGEHAAVVMAQVLYEEAPRLRRLRPELPVAQDELLAVQQAVELLQARWARPAGPEAAEAPTVWLNPLAARLLDLRFLVRRVGDGIMLGRERTGAEETRLLLGRRTPYVVRSQELALLEMQLQACMEDSRAQGMLVLAPSGMGKSRLLQEFLQRVGERQEGAEIIIGRGDPMRAGGTYGLLGQGLLEWCRLDAVGEVERRQRFAEKVGRHVAADRQEQVVEFLGEMCGVEFPDEHSPRLRAARQEPRLMNDQVTWAWVDLLRSECERHPVLLVLEDLHWSDAASVRLVDTALRELAEERFMVVALARPEVKELFPGLWAERPVQEVRLSALNRRASERLVREMLGGRSDDEVARIVDQAGGNALFLEELIRAAAEGEESGQPGTVTAMLQARFQRLEPGMQRTLEAASLMGETFWRGGVVVLLGAEGRDESEVTRWLSALVQTETLVLEKTSRFPGEAQYAFRHALLCDAAYGLLTEEELRSGHRRVGSYLERLGERDFGVLAEHFRRGGDRERAAGYFARLRRTRWRRTICRGPCAASSRASPAGRRARRSGSSGRWNHARSSGAGISRPPTRRAWPASPSYRPGATRGIRRSVR